VDSALIGRRRRVARAGQADRSTARAAPPCGSAAWRPAALGTAGASATVAVVSQEAQVFADPLAARSGGRYAGPRSAGTGGAI
jgi:hypothetical protein